MTDRTVRVVLKAVADEYRRTMRDAASDTDGLSKQVKKTTDQVHADYRKVGQGAMIAGGALLAGFGVAVGAAARFEKEMSGVKAVANATSGEMKQLSDAALKAGADTAFSATDAAQAEAELAKAGISVKDILGGALTGALSLAAAGQLDLADAATVSAQAMNVFKLEGKDVGHIADVLASAANKSAADVKDLADGLRQGGLVAAQTGLSLEETTGALAAFADNALIGSDAGTSLKTMLQRLTPQSAEAAEMMNDLGITAYDAGGNFVGLGKFAGSLQDGLKGLTAEQRNSALATIFGSDAVRAAAILYDEGADGINDYVNAVNDQGAAARMAATQMDNLAGDVEQLKGSLETTLIKSGSGANSVLRELTQAATGAVNAFGSLPKPVQQGVAGLGALVGVAGVAGGAVLIAVGQVQKFKLALETMGVSAETSSRAVGLVGKAAKGLGMAGAVVGVLALADALNQAGANGSKLPAVADGLVDVGGQIQLSGQALDTFGAGFENLPKKIDVAGRSLRWSFTTGQKSIKNARQDLDDLDSTLAGLVQGGHSQAAAELFEEISTAAKNGGVSTKDLDKAFGKYKDAVATANTQTKLAAQTTGDASDSALAYAEALEQQTDASKEAAEAIRNQSNALKAMFDPIFAVEDALSKQAEAQKAVNKALKEHGRRSEEYRQAQRDALRATVDLDGAVENLRAGLMDGSVSLKTVNGRLDDYARAGLITTDQAAAFKRQLALAAEQAGVLSGKLDGLDGKNVNAKVTIRVAGGVVLPSGDIKVQGGTLLKAAGGYVTGPGSATSDSIPARLSNGEYVINAAATAKHRQLLDMINGGGTFRPWTPTSSSVDNSRVFSPTLNIQAAPGENAQRSGVRALREALFLEGHG